MPVQFSDGIVGVKELLASALEVHQQPYLKARIREARAHAFAAQGGHKTIQSVRLRLNIDDAPLFSVVATLDVLEGRPDPAKIREAHIDRIPAAHDFVAFQAVEVILFCSSPGSHD